MFFWVWWSVFQFINRRFIHHRFGIQLVGNIRIHGESSLVRTHGFAQQASTWDGDCIFLLICLSQGRRTTRWIIRIREQRQVRLGTNPPMQYSENITVEESHCIWSHLVPVSKKNAKHMIAKNLIFWYFWCFSMYLFVSLFLCFILSAHNSQSV